MKLRKLNFRPWPVTVKFQEANAEGELFEAEQKFVAHFRHFSEAEYKAIVDGLGADGEKIGELPIADILDRNVRLFGQVIVGWDKLQDEDGLPVAYSLDALRAIVTGPDGMVISAAINVALSEIRFGSAAAKNSPTSAAPGPTPAPAGVATNSPTI